MRLSHTPLLRCATADNKIVAQTADAPGVRSGAAAIDKSAHGGTTATGPRRNRNDVRTVKRGARVRPNLDPNVFVSMAVTAPRAVRPRERRYRDGKPRSIVRFEINAAYRGLAFRGFEPAAGNFSTKRSIALAFFMPMTES